MIVAIGVYLEILANRCKCPPLSPCCCRQSGTSPPHSTLISPTYSSFLQTKDLVLALLSKEQESGQPRRSWKQLAGAINSLLSGGVDTFGAGVVVVTAPVGCRTVPLCRHDKRVAVMEGPRDKHRM